MDQKPFRTLILWVMWASAALVVYLTLYRDTDVWSFLETDPSRITWLIIGLFLLGLGGSFALTLLVTKEAYRTSHLDRIAREGGLSAIKVTGTKQLTDRFFGAIKDTMQRKGEVDVETLLHVELANFERGGHTVELIGNILITLGLIGTVMGLTLTLTGLTGSLNALGHDQEMLLTGLRHAMAGMGTAFYTTLLGAILGGVILRMFAQITQHGIEALHDSLLRICMIYCSAEFVQTTERDVRHLNEELKALEANIRQLETAFSKSHQVVIDFREEIRLFSDRKDEETGEPLHVMLKKHQAYCEMLRQEMHMLANLKKPWWIRLKNLFTFSK